MCTRWWPEDEQWVLEMRAAGILRASIRGDRVSEGTKVVSVRMRRSELDKLMKDAKRAGVTVSGLIRKRAVDPPCPSFRISYGGENLAPDICHIVEPNTTINSTHYQITLQSQNA